MSEAKIRTPQSLDIEGTWKIGGTAVTATAAEINAIAGTGVDATEFGYLDGALPGDVIASKAVVADASARISDSDLVLESLNPLTIRLNDTDGLQMDNAAISGFAGETDTAGLDVFAETEDAGGTATAAKTGGLLDIKTGDGSSGAGAVIAGAGGAQNWTTGLGGAASGTAAGGAGGALGLTGSAGGAHTGGGASGAGGAGGAVSAVAGVGGATSNVGTDNGGEGGAVSITAGDGGAASAGTGDGGGGANVTITCGAGGTTTGGVAGDPGRLKVAAGTVHFTDAQTIDMADAQVALTLNPGTPTGTLLTSNVLAVDANSAGTEDLLLPPEADCNGLQIFIGNTGGEDILVKDDGDAVTVCTISTAESATVACDGTTWRGGVLKTT